MSNVKSKFASHCFLVGQARLPKSNYAPSEATQFSIHRPIPGTISFDFCCPVFAIRFRQAVRSRVTVPEVAVDENHDALPRKNKIGAPWKG